MTKLCLNCRGLGFVNNKNGIDACSSCAFLAEIEYVEWKRHGPAQLTLDLEKDPRPNLPENVLDMREAWGHWE